jgi:hypothetical protein
MKTLHAMVSADDESFDLERVVQRESALGIAVQWSYSWLSSHLRTCELCGLVV